MEQTDGDIIKDLPPRCTSLDEGSLGHALREPPQLALERKYAEEEKTHIPDCLAVNLPAPQADVRR